MVITIQDKTDGAAISNPRKTVIMTDVEVELTEIFNGFGIPTEQGYFGISQRDGGIEVLLDGDLVFSSISLDDSYVIPNKEQWYQIFVNAKMTLESTNYIPKTIYQAIVALKRMRIALQKIVDFNN